MAAVGKSSREQTVHRGLPQTDIYSVPSSGLLEFLHVSYYKHNLQAALQCTAHVMHYAPASAPHVRHCKLYGKHRSFQRPFCTASVESCFVVSAACYCAKMSMVRHNTRLTFDIDARNEDLWLCNSWPSCHIKAFSSSDRKHTKRNLFPLI